MKLLRLAVISLSLATFAHAQQAKDLEGALSDEGRAVLEGPDSFEVLSIVCEREPAAGEDVVDGRYPVAKRVSITDAATRRAVVAAALESTRDATMCAACFEPHHAVIARRGDKQVQLVICFRCLTIYVEDPTKGHSSICTRNAPLVQTLNPLLGLAAPPIPPNERVLEGRRVDDWMVRIEDPAPLDEATRAAARRVADALLAGDAKSGAGLQILLRLDPPAAVPLLAEVVADRRSYSRSWAAAALGRIGPAAAPAVPALRTGLADEELAPTCVQALGSIGPAAVDAVPDLIAHLPAGSPDRLAVQGCLTLAKLGVKTPDVLLVLQRFLQDPRWNVRRAAAESLGQLGVPDSVIDLRPVVHDPDPQVRLTATVSLALLEGAPARAVPTVVDAVRGADRRLAYFAASQLARLAPTCPEAVAPLVECLADHDAWLQQAAAVGLGDCPATPEVIAALERASTSTERPVREAAQASLARLRGR